MGQGRSFAKDARERGCWSAVMYPKDAPEWFNKMIGGAGSGDVHVLPAPPDSALLIGYLSLAVPDLQMTENYWVDGGFAAGRSIHELKGEEVRTNFGPSQIRFPIKPGEPAQKWPGEVTFWVEDIRQTTDLFYMLGRTLGTDVVNEYKKATTGGEFMLKIYDPWHRNFFLATEAPRGWAQKVRAIGHDISEGDVACPTKTSNSLAIIDATVFVKSRDDMLGAARFYNHFLMVPSTGGGPTEYFTQMHFGPGEGLHQTLTFRQDASASYSDLGSICLYIKDRHKFVLALARCAAVGILMDPTKSKEDKQREGEFRVRGIINPDTREDIVPLVHLIRHASHPECPLH